jgi:hypothetical protein
MKPDPLVEIEVGVRGDTAAALGLAGRKLERAVQALAAFDQSRGRHANGRKDLLHVAADALWAYVVQKEAIGIGDNTKVNDSYGVTSEMWRLMGATCADDHRRAAGVQGRGGRR